MKIKCRNCHKFGISIMKAIAYSSDDRMICESCGSAMGFTKLGSVLYKFIEGCFILFSVMYSFYILSPFPLMISISFMIIVRAFLLPKFANKVEKKYKWRTK